MSSKKKTRSTATTAGQPALRIGSRVRCTDDGVEGRITWANAVAVKIKWDDGEEITWKRDSLATRPIEILDADRSAEADLQREQAAVRTPTAQPDAEATAPPGAEPEAPPPAATEQVAVPNPGAAESVPPAPRQSAPQEATAAGPAVPAPVPVPASESDTGEPAAPAKPKRERKAKTPVQHKDKKLSAIDAAAKVLAEAGQPLSCKEMIGAMAAKGYWTSPGGQTPDATLCSAIVRELAVKGEHGRFVKTGPGRFALRPVSPQPESARNAT